MKKSFLKHLLALILVVAIFLIIYISYQKYEQYKIKDVQQITEIEGIIKESAGKLSMYGAYYIQKDNSSKMIFLEGKIINLSRHLDKRVVIKGHLSNRKLECLPNLQCGPEKYKIFIISEIKYITIEGELYIERKTNSRKMINGYWLIGSDDKLNNFVGKKIRVFGKEIESECDELNRLYPENRGMHQCMTGPRFQVKEVAGI